MPSKPKCSICEKNFKPYMIQMHKCRCKKLFCSTHMHVHDCCYDYTTDQLSDKAVICDKVDKI